MVRRNKRDAKFLIFQSLYIIAISILFYKGTDLSLNKVSEVNPGDTVVKVTVVPSPEDTVVSKILKFYDPRIEEITKKLEEGLKYVPAASNDTVVAKEILKAKDNRIADLERLKTPANIRRPQERGEPTPKSEIEGGRIEKKNK